MAISFNPPTPPPLPSIFFDGKETPGAVKGFHVKGYHELLRTVPNTSEDNERILLDIDLDKISESEARAFAHRVHNSLAFPKIDKRREFTVLALKALQLDLISVEQVASLCILDGAISDLVTHILSFFTYLCTKDRKVFSRQVFYPIDDPNDHPDEKCATIPYPYQSILCPPEISVTDLPDEFQTPNLKRYFNLNDEDWELFKAKIECLENPSEQHFRVLNAPYSGSWSVLKEAIDKLMNSFKDQERPAIGSETLGTEKIIIIPSFSMFQIYADIRAEKQGRGKITLLPMLGMPDEALYTRLKSVDTIGMSLYLPESSEEKRYNIDNPKFKTEIDTFPKEGPFVLIIHDDFHAHQRLHLSNQVSNAISRLSLIARHHPKDFKRVRKVSEYLDDGELICTYSPHDKWAPLKRTAKEAQIFGDIFDLPFFRAILSSKLKKAMIADMVIHDDEWREEFNIGRESLRPPEQKMYDDIGAELYPDPG